MKSILYFNTHRNRGKKREKDVVSSMGLLIPVLRKAQQTPTAHSRVPVPAKVRHVETPSLPS